MKEIASAEVSIEEFANTVAAYEAAAIKTGKWDGIESPEFSSDGVAWSTVWVGEGAPNFARVTVHRKGVKIPYTAVIAWAEAIPAVDEWRVLWERKPMTLFGAAAKRAAIRHAFRDIIGDRRDPDEVDPAAPPAAAVSERDWDAEIQAAPDVDTLDALWLEMRGHRARTGAREVAKTTRRTELSTMGPLKADEWELTQERGRQIAEQFVGTPSPQRQGPRDYLPPANRAARRKKKGRRS
ncbi:hypothetical protein [Microbacterium sp. A1-JK]|uniref:hypothetical protein n=1 Tax=Microbacterium sp. A1-JK TaxID=3177516 RepID=UPI00388461E9